jgi:hypothetical protein
VASGLGFFLTGLAFARERYQPRRCAALIHLLANRVEVTEHG